jgi:hypothetical protein
MESVKDRPTYTVALQDRDGDAHSALPSRKDSLSETG